MIPSPKTANRVRAPPENRLRKPRIPPALACCSSCCTALKLMPGTGTFAPNWYSEMMSRVKRTLFRRSGTLNMFLRLESMEAPRPANCSAVGQGVALRRRTTAAEGGRDDPHGTACCGDGRLGRGREGVRLDAQGPVDLATAQNLHQASLVDQPGRTERLGVDLVALGGVQRIEVDDVVLHPEGVLEPLELGDPLGQRQLATLEARLHRVPRPLALHAPAGGLAALAGDAPADAPAGPGGTRRRLEVVQLHRPPPWPAAPSPGSERTEPRWGPRAN